MKKLSGKRFRKNAWTVVGKANFHGITGSAYQHVADLLVAREYDLPQKAADKSADAIECLLLLMERAA